MPTLSQLKGIHPGPYIEWELRKRSIDKDAFARAIEENPEELLEIMNAKRDMTATLALRIEKELKLKMGMLIELQAFYHSEEERKRDQKKPDLSRFSKSLFWDTDINKIDWEKHKRAVIERTFQRGDQEDKAEVLNFYGTEEVDAILGGK